MNKLFMKSTLIVCLFITILFGSTSIAAKKATTKTSTNTGNKTTTAKICYHNWVTYAKTEPNCTNSGIEYLKCTLCGELETEILRPNGKHEWILVEKIEPTCIADGQYNYKCKYCSLNMVEHKRKNSNAHKYEIIEHKTPDCTEKGFTRYRCTICNNETRKEYAAWGHSEQKIYVPPTCKDFGYTRTKCRRCNLELGLTFIPPNKSAHTFSGWSFYEERKAIEFSVLVILNVWRRTCIHCGEYEEKIEYKYIPNNAHSVDYDPYTRVTTTNTIPATSTSRITSVIRNNINSAINGTGPSVTLSMN